jgi:RNA polymerase sigma-70 factor (ECF subfamily)
MDLMTRLSTDLIVKWQAGDEDAFEALFRQYYRLVFKTAYVMMGSKEEAEDVLQEAFIAMWKSRKTFDPDKGKLTTWLCRITVNQCNNRLRAKRIPVTSLDEAKNDGFDLPDTSVQLPEELCAKRWEYEQAVKAISSLDGKHRAAVVLRYFGDLSYEEIAQVLEIPLGTVKSRLNQGLRMLHRKVGDNGYEEAVRG